MMNRRQILGVLAALMTQPLSTVQPVRVLNIAAETVTTGMKLGKDGIPWAIKTVTGYSVKLSDGRILRNLQPDKVHPWLMQYARQIGAFIPQVAPTMKAVGNVHVQSGKLPKL